MVSLVRLRASRAHSDDALEPAISTGGEKNHMRSPGSRKISGSNVTIAASSNHRITTSICPGARPVAPLNPDVIRGGALRGALPRSDAVGVPCAPINDLRQ